MFPSLPGVCGQHCGARERYRPLITIALGWRWEDNITSHSSQASLWQDRPASGDWRPAASSPVKNWSDHPPGLEAQHFVKDIKIKSCAWCNVQCWVFQTMIMIVNLKLEMLLCWRHISISPTRNTLTSYWSKIYHSIYHVGRHKQSSSYSKI